jgi:uncharacterized protein (DUF488 family)
VADSRVARNAARRAGAVTERLSICTVGHSSHELEEFLALLRAHGVQQVADVRRFPGSQRFPHFHAEALSAALAAAGIGYTHFRDLGGRRQPRPDSPNLGLRSAAFRGYADHMESAAFARALESLLHRAASSRVAVMCAEADPAHCHRRILADALTARGVRVEHIRSEEVITPHALSPGARVEAGRVTYPPAGAPRPGAGETGLLFDH